MKFCKDCRWYSGSCDGDTCLQPGMQPKPEPVNGIVFSPNCRDIRSDDTACGFDGDLWEKRVPWWAWWRK